MAWFDCIGKTYSVKSKSFSKGYAGSGTVDLTFDLNGFDANWKNYGLTLDKLYVTVDGQFEEVGSEFGNHDDYEISNLTLPNATITSFDQTKGIIHVKVTPPVYYRKDYDMSSPYLKRDYEYKQARCEVTISFPIIE